MNRKEAFIKGKIVHDSQGQEGVPEATGSREFFFPPSGKMFKSLCIPTEIELLHNISLRCIIKRVTIVKGFTAFIVSVKYWL